VIENPHPGVDQHQKLTTSRGSPLAHAYRVWSTSVTALVSYPAHRQNEWQTDRTNDHNNHSSSLGVVITKVVSCDVHSTIRPTAYCAYSLLMCAIGVYTVHTRRTVDSYVQWLNGTFMMWWAV